MSLFHFEISPSRPSVPPTVLAPKLVAVTTELGALSGERPTWHERDHGPWLLIDADPDRPQDVPPEFFLRELLAVDSDDLDSVAQWIGTWGVLLPPPMLRNRTRHLRLIRQPATPEAARVVVQAPRERRGRKNNDWKRTLLDDLERAAEAAGVFRRRFHEDEFYEYDGLQVRPMPLSAAAFGIRLHQALARCWAAMPPEVTEDWLAEKSVSTLWPWLMLAEEFSPLDGLLVTVELTADLLSTCEPLTIDMVLTDGKGLMIPSADIGQVVALQIAAFVSERAVAKRCANETCSNYFVRQRGRAKVGQHHLRGVKYCQDSCARAQAQREYRRRRRAISHG